MKVVRTPVRKYHDYKKKKKFEITSPTNENPHDLHHSLLTCQQHNCLPDKHEKHEITFAEWDGDNLPWSSETPRDENWGVEVVNHVLMIVLLRQIVIAIASALFNHPTKLMSDPKESDRKMIIYYTYMKYNTKYSYS